MIRAALMGPSVNIIFVNIKEYHYLALDQKVDQPDGALNICVATHWSQGMTSLEIGNGVTDNFHSMTMIQESRNPSKHERP